MSNWLGLFLSALYLVVILGISMICYKRKKFSGMETRKFIHIGVCNWWLIAWIFFDNYIIASIIPALFIVFNYCNYRFNFIGGMEEADPKKRNLGTTWYAISVFILTLILFQQEEYMYIGAIAILILGYGDGLAGLVGNFFGKHKLEVHQKSIEGCLTMFVMSFLLSAILLNPIVASSSVLPYALCIASFATMVELYCTKGWDNLTVPLGVAGFTYLLVEHSDWFMPIAVAISLTAVIMMLVLMRKLLTPSASFAAFLLGVSIYVLGGPIPYCALLLFFLTSAMIEAGQKESNKKHQRDLSQVEENGLACLLFCIMYYFTQSEVALTAAFVSLAGATADTWSSGIGYYSKERVKSILTGKPLPKGESGGVTRLGTLGAFLGALLIALFSLLAPGVNIWIRFIIILVFGFFTSILDSIFGLFLQVKYYDPKKGIILEKRPKNMKGIEKISGYNFLTNGMVNFVTIMISSILSALVGILVL